MLSWRSRKSWEGRERVLCSYGLVTNHDGKARLLLILDQSIVPSGNAILNKLTQSTVTITQGTEWLSINILDFLI
jgi:hypothetical protein